MLWFKTSRIVYVLWLFLLLYTFSSIDANAYQYRLWVSRKYYNGSNHYIVGTWNILWYSPEYFTGLWYCTWYYYLNHNRDLLTDDDMSLARQVLKYDATNVDLSGDYINLKLNAWSTTWDTNNLYGPFTDSWNSLFRFNILKTTWSPFIPLTYTLWRFRIKNYQAISGTNLSLYYLNPSSVDASTYINHTNSTFNTNADRTYNVDIVYYAQPCIPDMPISSAETNKINGNSDGQYALASVPAFDFLSNGTTNANAGRPLTHGITTPADTSYFVPGARNVWSFNEHLSFDNGIFLAGIKEPDKSSQPNESFDQRYYYNAGVAMFSGYSLLDSTFVSAPWTTNNQRGINPDTIKVYVTFTGIDKTNYGDTWVPCTVTITGNINLWLSGLGYSWNRNQLGYSVNISSGTIRTIAKQQCVWLSSITTENIDIKRETVANIQWDAYDYSNSMIISQNHNTVTYASANRITWTTGYSFNSYTDVPVLSMATDTMALIDWDQILNVPINNSQLRFTGTDTYAGINSGTFLIIISGYNSSITKSDSRRTSWTPDYNYVFSGNDISKFEFNLHNERYDYTGFIDFISKGTVTTGMYFTVYFRAIDFVGNTSTQNYVFRTPTWPNAPKQSPSNIILTAQSKNAIAQVNILNNIKDTDTVDGTDLWYNYSTYYPHHRDLINDLWYISGSQVLASTQDLVLTAPNGNVGWATTVTMTWLQFVYNGTGSTIVGTPYVTSGGAVMTDYISTTFTFKVLATNIYGITGEITYNITVAPSCTESAGCTDPVYVFRGTTLSGAIAQRTAALLSGEAYLKTNHWYPHRYAEIKQTGPNFLFANANDSLDPTAQILYCASTGNQLLINYGWYTGPQGILAESSLSATYTGNSLFVTWWTIFLFNVFTASVTADYITQLDGGQQKMTIYVNRPLTGRIFTSVCEFTGTTLDEFGCPTVASHNRTGDINWKKLTSSDLFVMTWRLEGGRFTGNRNGYITGGSSNIGDQFTFWSTGTVYNGGWTRIYTTSITWDTQQDINTSGSVNFSIENRTGDTSLVSHEIYWIDNTLPDWTGYVSSTEPTHSATFTLSGYNTGQLSNSSVSNLIWDDEYIITKFSGAVEPQLFENLYGSPIHTWDRYINGTGSIYSLTHTTTFASNWTGEICTQDRAGNEACIYVEVMGIGNLTDLMITVRPAFRPDPATNDTGYKLVNGDFWFRVKSWSTWIQNYNSATVPANPKITTNKYGTGIVSINTPADGTEYLVVFKWDGTLSAGFTGIWNNSTTELNFFSWSYADNFSSDFVYKYTTGSVTEHYLKVGDIVADTTWSYDFIKDSDFAQINYNLSIGTNILPFSRFDFDINNIISSMEQSMILQAWDSHGFIGWLDSNTIIPMTDFINI